MNYKNTQTANQFFFKCMNKMRNSTTRNHNNHLTFEKHNNYTKRFNIELQMQTLPCRRISDLEDRPFEIIQKRKKEKEKKG